MKLGARTVTVERRQRLGPPLPHSGMTLSKIITEKITIVPSENNYYVLTFDRRIEGDEGVETVRKVFVYANFAEAVAVIKKELGEA